MVIRHLDDGALRFLRPHDQHGIRIDQNTAATRWRGEKMDYSLAIEVLLQHSKRAPRVSAETR